MQLAGVKSYNQPLIEPVFYPRYAQRLLAEALVGVEVKAGATVTASDFRGLRKLRDVAGSRFAYGVVFYDGEMTVSFGGGLYAVPVRRLWETP